MPLTIYSRGPMAKLKARGRTEIWKVAKEGPTPNSDLIIWEKSEVTLMSEGSLLERRVVRFKPDKYDLKGRLHDYGWKVKGKMKPTLTPSQALEIYQKRGYALMGEPKMDSFSTNYAKAIEASKVRKTKDATKRAAEVAPGGKHGPGFYVTNGKTDAGIFSLKSRVAELGPYQSQETAEEKATDRFHNFVQMRFTYLLPVKVVYANSRRDAEENKGDVRWINGKSLGPAVSPHQLKMFEG